MRFLRYIFPTSPVVALGLNVDSLVYLTLLTLNPILVWIFVYLNTLSKTYAILIDCLWILRGLNICTRQGGKSGISTLKNRVVLITGGGDGLGRKIAEAFCTLEDVAKVIVVDVKFQGNVKDKKMTFIKFDLNDDIEKLQALVNLQNIDVLVCNAGMRQHQQISEETDVEIKKIINVNWIFHTILVKNYIRAVNSQNLVKDKYSIVVVGSVLGFVGPKCLGIYAGTKNALLAGMDSLREEIDSKFVLSTILPGQLNSQMFADVHVNSFLAPVVDIDKLAWRVVSIVEYGMNGTFAYPLYGRFLPVYRILPWCLQRFCRWYSGMDHV